jgi:hypothetical protein
MKLSALTARSILSSVTDAPTPATSETMNASGQPVQSFVKDLIRVGEFYKASTDQDMSVSPADLDHWVASFLMMKSAGVKVPVPLDHSMNAEHNRGWLNRMFRVGDTLYGELELVGRDAIDMAGRTEVSVSIVPELIDGHGNKFQRVIEHVALTAYPVIPGQGGFIKLSRDGQEIQVPVYRLSQSNPHKESSMELATLLGIDLAGKSPEDVMKECKARITAMNTELSKYKTDLSTATTELSTVKTELSRAKSPPKEIDPVTLDLAAENRTMKIDQRVAAGRLPRTAADKLKAAWIGSDKANLSRTLDAEGRGRFDATMEAIDEIKPLRPVGAVAGHQTLSRQAPVDDATSTTPAKDDKLQEARKANLAR